MSEHTTHFDDCGCLRERHEAEIAEYREASINAQLLDQATIQSLGAERDALRAKLEDRETALATWKAVGADLSAQLDAARSEVERLRGVLERFDPNDPQGFLQVIEKALAGKEAGG